MISTGVWAGHHLNGVMLAVCRWSRTLAIPTASVTSSTPRLYPRAWAAPRLESWLALATFLGVITIDAVPGLIIDIGGNDRLDVTTSEHAWRLHDDDLALQ